MFSSLGFYCNYSTEKDIPATAGKKFTELAQAHTRTQANTGFIAQNNSEKAPG